MIKSVYNYRILIEPETYEDGSIVYVAHCPTLQISDYGDTVEEVLMSIKDGIQLAIETIQKEGEEIPKDNIENQIITSTQIEISSVDNTHHSYAL